MVRLRELHVAEDVELTQTTAGEDGEEEAAGSERPPASVQRERLRRSYYSFEVAVTMAMPVAGLAPNVGARPGAARRWRMSLTERDKKIVMVLVPLVVVLGYWFLLLAPKREAAARPRRRSRRSRRSSRRPQSRASTVQAAKTNFARDYAAVVALGKAIPTSVDMPSLLVQLDQAAHGTGIEFDGVTIGERASVAGPAPAAGTPPASDPGAAHGAERRAAPERSRRRLRPTPSRRAERRARRRPPRRRRLRDGSDRSRGRRRRRRCPGGGALESVSLEFNFTGSFFELADFFHG